MKDARGEAEGEVETNAGDEGWGEEDGWEAEDTWDEAWYEANGEGWDEGEQWGGAAESIPGQPEDRLEKFWREHPDADIKFSSKKEDAENQKRGGPNRAC